MIAVGIDAVFQEESYISSVSSIDLKLITKVKSDDQSPKLLLYFE